MTITPDINRRLTKAVQAREKGLTFSQIGNMLGISSERARQLVAQGTVPKYSIDELIAFEWPLDIMVSNDGVDTRLLNCARNQRRSLSSLAELSDRELLRLPNFGIKCVARLRGLTKTTGDTAKPRNDCPHCGKPLGFFK